ncbi:hypothetical protein [Noviherbaspirillum sp. Root189]|uniref:hypothetical protein n=1 Tax=Noviherbaspirillum sp. Root189 TaxID=1736487 RepID=UPI0012E3CCED|nr:hypothetical protein [Noviherbaspirillum sp. Root189]
MSLNKIRNLSAGAGATAATVRLAFPLLRERVGKWATLIFKGVVHACRRLDE